MEGYVVITGAGSGLGRELALTYAEQGYAVLGTATNMDQQIDLAEASHGKVKLFLCDLSQPTELVHFAQEVERYSDGKVEQLVLNAGILTPGPLELISLEALLLEFQVNTFSVFTLTNALLPVLRAAKGRIIHISTVSVDFPSPFNGLSAASKAATEALMTVYRSELAAFGISVTIVAPGNMQTGGPAKTAAAIAAVSQKFTDEQQSRYGESFSRFAKRMNNGQAHGLSAVTAAQQIFALSKQQPAPIRVAIGADAEELINYVKNTSPEEQEKRRLNTIQG